LLTATAAHCGTPTGQELQGKWVVKSFEYNGSEVERLKNAIREFKDGKYSLTPKTGEAIEGAVMLDATQSPKAIDLDVNGRVIKGIYELDGDTLTLCYNLASDERPSEFASKPDTGLIKVVHAREK
jgi:uncharacterized protein (TIGR03067 family)